MNLRLFFATCPAMIVLAVAPLLRAQAWLPPTPEELAMTSVAEVPGAPAVILFREQTTDDSMRMFSFYSRLKVLTEGGKDYANVELPFGSKLGISLDSISARTIHPDGTVVPFTGKPYEKVVERVGGYKLKTKVFTLPDVQVGSILEYRYRFHYDDSYFMHPDWYIQSDLFLRKAHYLWRPNHSSYQQISDDRGTVLDRIAWTPILPAGVQVKQTTSQGATILELDVANVMPFPKEEFMPPLDSFSYRVLFYYTAYKDSAEFWNKEGKRWTKDRDRFIGPGKQVRDAVNAMLTPADTADQKLYKIYAAVSAFENTDFTRERSSQEDRAAGLKATQSTDDILSRKRGSGDQLTDLFVAMARAAGMKAYLAAVSDRNERLFYPAYLSLSQLDDYIAIVNVDGKDLFFDPGQRYCEYGHLAWKHSLTGGLRQMDGGNGVLFTTPANSYKDEHTSRVADLTLDERGAATGTVTLTYSGDPALRWRQEALRGDDTSLNADLKENLEHLLPGGMDVRVLKVDNLTNSTQPLQITYEIKGPIGSSTGKRLLVPANLFETNSKPKFPQSKRELSIDMHYPSVIQDAVRFKLPGGIVIESAPAADNGTLKGFAGFTTSSKTASNSVTLYRNVTVAKTFFMPDDYADLRGFYSKLEAKDQETLILTHAGAAAASGENELR